MELRLGLEGWKDGKNNIKRWVPQLKNTNKKATKVKLHQFIKALSALLI